MIRERLLEAAGEVFAERGFRDATVREICKRADMNQAAVNYYFGDKKGIYEAALRYAHRHAVEKHPPGEGIAPGAPPEERLRAFISAFLRRILDEGRPSWHGKLITREIIEPTEVLDKLIDEEIRPRHELLRAIVRDILGDAGKVQVSLCAESILAQCLFYRHSHAFMRRLRPEQGYGSEEIGKLADHIAGFSLAALTEIKGRRLEADDR
jgi:TetR/AcrR family transcriptional regulator, regulator of cefoperazone and chloramphenicol sensitivity